MKLPDRFSLIEERQDTYKVRIKLKYSEAELEFQKYLLPRMLRDVGFTSMLINRFARYVTWDGWRPLNADYSGVVPSDLPFAVTDYENLPFGYEKVFEDKNEVHLVSPPDMGGDKILCWWFLLICGRGFVQMIHGVDMLILNTLFLLMMAIKSTIGLGERGV